MKRHYALLRRLAVTIVPCIAKGFRITHAWQAYVAGIMLTACSACGFEYEATGQLRGQIHLARNRVQEIPPVFFHVFVRDCQWMVRITSSEASEAGMSWQTSCDGLYVYKFGRIDGREGTPYWGGSITSEQVPFFGPIPTMPIIWLALANSCYLDKSQGIMLPPYSADVLRVPLEFHAVRRRSPPQLAEFIYFMDDGYDRKDGKPRRWPAPFDEGFTNAILSNTSFTNIGGLDIPIQFSLRTFRPASGKGAEWQLEPERVFQGFVSNVSTRCSMVNFVPDLPSDVEGNISDFRLSVPHAAVPMPFEYRSTKWLSTGEVRQLPGFSDYMRSQQTLSNFVPVLVTQGRADTTKLSIRSRVVLIILFVTISAVPLILFWSMSRRKEQPNKK